MLSGMFAELYEFVQEREVPISRRDLKPKVLELAELEGVKEFRSSELCPHTLRGVFIKPGAGLGHPYEKFSDGQPIIILSRELNHCWSRFVYVKELLHVFDEPLERVGTGDEFFTLIEGFTAPALRSERSKAMQSEVECFWAAVALLCPEEIRQGFGRRRDAKQVTDLEIAQELKIPEQYVPRLFHQNFKAIVQHLQG